MIIDQISYSCDWDTWAFWQKSNCTLTFINALSSILLLRKEKTFWINEHVEKYSNNFFKKQIFYNRHLADATWIAFLIHGLHFFQPIPQSGSSVLPEKAPGDPPGTLWRGIWSSRGSNRQLCSSRRTLSTPYATVVPLPLMTIVYILKKQANNSRTL